MLTAIAKTVKRGTQLALQKLIDEASIWRRTVIVKELVTEEAVPEDP